MDDKFPLKNFTRVFKSKQPHLHDDSWMQEKCFSFLLKGNNVSQECISVSSKKGPWGDKEINYSYKCNYHDTAPEM